MAEDHEAWDATWNAAVASFEAAFASSNLKTYEEDGATALDSIGWGNLSNLSRYSSLRFFYYVLLTSWLQILSCRGAAFGADDSKWAGDIAPEWVDVFSEDGDSTWYNGILQWANDAVSGSACSAYPDPGLLDDQFSWSQSSMCFLLVCVRRFAWVHWWRGRRPAFREQSIWSIWVFNW